MSAVFKFMIVGDMIFLLNTRAILELIRDGELVFSFGGAFILGFCFNVVGMIAHDEGCQYYCRWVGSLIVTFRGFFSSIFASRGDSYCSYFAHLPYY